MENKIKIELSNNDAERFKEFNQYYNKFIALLDGEVLTAKCSQFIIDIDSGGNIRSIKMTTTKKFN